MRAIGCLVVVLLAAAAALLVGCAGGALKKICDCCRANHPNVHGYCPSGTNVLCIVESCGADPRVQVVALRRIRDGR